MQHLKQTAQEQAESLGAQSIVNCNSQCAFWAYLLCISRLLSQGLIHLGGLNQKETPKYVHVYNHRFLEIFQASG